MGRTRDSLKHQMRTAALDGIQGNDTRKAYRRACDAFSVWAKDQGIRDREEVTADVLQRYEEYLEGRPERYTPATIHAKLAAPCKAAGVSMNEIRKPKRTASRIVRGRREKSEQKRGDREADQERYARLVTLQRAVGIRRAELAALRGGDLIEDRGQLYVLVRRGKGGKEQRQYVLPSDRETVRAVFAGVGERERVFSPEEMENHINLHGMRAAHAKRCYDYYEKKLTGSESARSALRGVLLRRWENGHAELRERDRGRYSAARARFIADMDDRPYLLRGENRQKAEELGLPVEYCRLALMAVSVFHLSHWRLDVSVTNYLVQ